METKAIAINQTMPVFKSKELNKATQVIFDAVNIFNTTASETRKVVAVQLSRIENGKLYKDDGCKSLAEYGERIGLDKSLTHKLENAGRLLDSKTAQVKNLAADMDYSKLSILASVDEKELAAAVDKGEIKPGMSQREVKEWKEAHASKPDKVKVLPQYEVNLKLQKGDRKHYDAIALEAIEELDGLQKVGTVKFDGEHVPTAVYINPATLETVVMTYEKVVAKPVKKAATLDVKNMSDDMLKALMEEYARRQASKK